MANGWELLDEMLETRYSLRWRWGFWQVVRTVGFIDEESVEQSYTRKAPAVAHLVRLKLEGKRVTL